MLAIMGGTGVYDLAGMQVDEGLDAGTPFGTPSGNVVRGRLHGRDLLLLARHGAGHRLLPHEVNYRANVYALKRAGATTVLGFLAVGSLAERVAPGELAMTARAWSRRATCSTAFWRDRCCSPSGRSVPRSPVPSSRPTMP